MARQIVVCGASSSGKTTLIEDWLEKNKGFHYLKEVARDVMVEHSISREDVAESLKTEDKAVFLKLQRLIIEEQNRRELDLLGKGLCFIADRGPDPVAFAYNNIGRRAAVQFIEDYPAAQACLRRYREYLVVVVCPLKPEDDGFRVVPTSKEQQKYDKFLRELLHEHQIPHIYISTTDRQKRVHVLQQAVEGTFPFDSDNLEIYPLDVPFLRTRKPLPNRVTLRRLEISTDRGISASFLQLSRGESNRIVDRYGEESFVVLEFHKSVSPREVTRVLRKGVWVDGKEFQFLGCSSSGLKNRTCYMWQGTKEDVERTLAECGDFSAIKSVSKRLKRIGLLFSAAKPTHVEIPDDNVEEINDIETRSGNFTDGCGAVGAELAKRVVEGARLYHELPDYCPSVFQIRFQGCKGVVMTDPRLKGTDLVVRKSMKKFSPGTKPYQELWLCGYSRPYTYGHLNRQFIMLFSGLGINDEAFLQHQEDHFKQVESMTEVPEVAIKMLLWDNQPGMAAKVSKCLSSEEFRTSMDIQREVSKLQSKLISKMEKLRLLVEQSRNVYGVCDPLGVLKYGECFFRPTIRGTPKTVSGFVTVAKNPCYLLGDVRTLTAVDDDRIHGLKHLVDCIVFPTQGKRPHPAEIAGSDLDGDQYFVCWNPRFVVQSLRKPYHYPSIEALPSSTVTREETIDYFSRQNTQSSTMGKIDACYKYWADLKGVDCPECEELGMLFSRSVDASKTGDRLTIRRGLLSPKETKPNGASPSSSRVWKRMEYAAEEKRRQLEKKVVTTALGSSANTSPAVGEEFIWSLLLDEELNLSAFELFRFVQRWCAGQAYSDQDLANKLCEISEYINFGKFTVDQQKEAIDAGIPFAVVTNALNKSQILLPDVLTSFSLHSPRCEWRFYFRSCYTEFDWRHFLRAVQCYPESMVVFQLPQGNVAALHFLTKLKPGETDLVAGSVVAYFFSSHFGVHTRHVLGPYYNLNLDDEILQLYSAGDKTRTFVWLGNEQEKDKISIDLTRFQGKTRQHPRVRRDSVHCVEVFVKSSDHQPAYLDSYVAFQPDHLSPDEITKTEELEELPSDDESDDETETAAMKLEPYNFDAALSILEQSAISGSSSHFLEVLQLILTKEGSKIPEIIHESLKILLKNLVIRHAHKLPTPTLVEHLQVIITSLYHHVPIQSPRSCLQLLEGLSRLHCIELIEQVVSPLSTTLQLSSCAEYLETVSDWKCWCFLPKADAIRITKTLYTLCQSVLDGKTPPDNHELETLSSKDPLESLEQLASASTSANVGVDHLQVMRYTCHFGHLLLQHFLNELSSLRDQGNANADSRVLMLNISDPHYSAEQSRRDVDNPQLQDSQDEKQTERTTKFEFSRTEGFNSRKFTIGTYVTISLMTKAKSKTSVTFRPVGLGRIVQVSSHPTCIVVDVLQSVPHSLEKSAQLKKGHWELRLVGNVTTFSRAMQALLRLLDTQKKPTELMPLLVHQDAFPPVTTVEDCSSLETIPATRDSSAVTSKHVLPDNVKLSISFNSNQKQAIAAALTRRLTLIHGPPGTGKTRVACEIVRCWLTKGEGCALVAAETNMAVDNLTRQLFQLGLRVIRIGSLGHIARDVVHTSLERQVEMKRIEMVKDKRKSPFLDPKMAKQILRAAQVVATTCAGAGDPILKGMTFPFVLIDEATQATEPNSLLPIMWQCQQLTLIGDPQQLAPTIPCTPPSQPETSDHNSPPVTLLAVTLFHRLQSALPSFFLDEQHRMHPAIAEFPSQAFYGGKLKTAASLESRPPLAVSWLKAEKPLVFIDVPGSDHEKRVGTSFKNDAEADVVVKVVRSLVGCEVTPQEITVLTPYAAQVQCIRDKLFLEVNKVEVCTVDSFQGRENDVIVFSTVRSKPGRMDFTGDRFRMNVLLTRAKRGLVGVGSADCLQANRETLWAKWLDQANVVTEEEFQKVVDESKTKKKKRVQGGGNSSRQVEQAGAYPQDSSQGRYSKQRFPASSQDRHRHQGHPSSSEYGESSERPGRLSSGQRGPRMRGGRHASRSYSLGQTEDREQAGRHGWRGSRPSHERGGGRPGWGPGQDEDREQGGRHSWRRTRPSYGRQNRRQGWGQVQEVQRGHGGRSSRGSHHRVVERAQRGQGGRPAWDPQQRGELEETGRPSWEGGWEQQGRGPGS